MTDADTPHRYREQRRHLAELSRLAMGQARLSDELARRDLDARREHLLDFDRMVRIVRMGAAFMVRLDQAAEGRLRTPAERVERFERRAAEAVREAADPRLTPLPGLPTLGLEPSPPCGERVGSGGVSAEVPGPHPHPNPSPQGGGALAPETAPPAPRTQAEIAREALRQRRLAHAAPAPPLRRSG